MTKKERRKRKRLPLTLSIAKPIRLEFHSEHHDETIPGILANLSSSGMALIVFHHIPKDSMIVFDLDFVGIKEKIRGRIVREERKYEDVNMVGVKFEEESRALKETVEKMAEDYDICEVRFIVDPETACFPECHFRPLCGRRIKKEFSNEETK